MIPKYIRYFSGGNSLFMLRHSKRNFHISLESNGKAKLCGCFRCIRLYKAKRVIWCRKHREVLNKNIWKSRYKYR